MLSEVTYQIQLLISRMTGGTLPPAADAHALAGVAVIAIASLAVLAFRRPRLPEQDVRSVQR